MKARVVVFIADEFQGGDSEILTKESLKIEQYMLNPVVLKDYNINNVLIGKVTNLTWDGNKLVADIELTPGSEESFWKSYPAIGYICNTRELMSISLCGAKNVDGRIKTLEEQIGRGNLDGP